MNPRLPDLELWSEVEPYLDQALDLEQAAREPWLTELAATHPHAARIVRDMLCERDALNAAGFLASPLFVVDSAVADYERTRLERLQAFDLAPNRVVGPYRLIREIGYGGMSSVWLAERSDGEIKREVALKLPLTHQRFHLQRFMRERDILAALTHPNIARLYDAGITESGQPFLAMEYVAGISITQACNTRRATLRERLTLFMQVLEAVQFAHAQLIIHRDLKPSNVLLTSDGRVVLVDFGIGKLLNDGAQDSQLTQLFGRPLTPHYAAPEQITGDALSTAADIYSLGVILYELLSGTSPYRPRHSSNAALEEAVLSGAVVPPSRSALSIESATARGSSIRTLARQLSGDLDTIVLKAMQREPVRRYVSASAFAQDLHDYLHSLPVSARPDSVWYRAKCFVTRYKTLVIATAGAAAAMLSFIAFALWQAHAASIARDHSLTLAARNKAVTEFVDTVIRDAADSPAPITVSQLLARSERLILSEATDNPETRAAVLDIIARHYGYLEEHHRARDLLRQASAALQSSQDRALLTRVACDLAVSRFFVESAEEAVRTLKREAYRPDCDPEAAAQCLSDLSGLILQTETNNAMRHADDGLKLLQGLGPEVGSLEGSLLGRLAFGHYLVGNIPTAEQFFARALDRYRQIGRERSGDAMIIRIDWATALSGAGMPRRALQMYDEAEQMQRDREPGAEPDTTTVGNRAVVLTQLGRYEEARAAYELECQLAGRRKDAYSQLHCLDRLAELRLEARAPDDAAGYLRKADPWRSQIPPDSLELSVNTIVHARLALARGNASGARAMLEKIALVDASPSINLRLLRAKAETELAASNPSRAVDYAQQAVDLAATLQGGVSHSSHTGISLLLLGRAQQSLAQAVKARATLQAAAENLEHTVDAEHPALIEARAMLQKL